MRSGHPSLRPPIDRETLLRMWNDTDYPIRRIALKFGVTSSSIRRLANRYRTEGAHVIERRREGWYS